MSSDVLSAAKVVLVTIGYIGGVAALIVIPGMQCALWEAGQEIGDKNLEIEDLESDLRKSESDLRFAKYVYDEQCALTDGIIRYGYAHTTLEAIREQGGEPPEYKWETNSEVQFDTGGISPNPPGSVIVYTGRGFNGCPEFKFVFPTAVKKGEVVVSPDGMRKMIKDWAASKKVEMPGAIPEAKGE